MAGGFQHRSMAKESVYASAEFREGYSPPPESAPAKPLKRSFAELMAIAGYEPEAEPVKKAKLVTKHKESTSSNDDLLVKESREKNVADEYNPEQPLIVAEPLLQYLKALKGTTVVEARIAERAATPAYKHNPHFVEHLVAGAPYTEEMCKVCTRSRKCRRHRTVCEARTSVSLCVHTYVTVIWAVDDPVNEKGSWKVEIKDYGLDTDIARWEHANDCKPYRPSERVGVLARRLVEDLGDERVMRGVVPRRGNVGRADREIRTLVAAWERARVVRKAREEERRGKSERKAQNMLKGTLRKAHGMEEQRKKDDFKRKQREFRDAAQPKAEELSKVATEKMPYTFPLHPSATTGPFMRSETPQLDTHKISEPDVHEPDTPKTLIPISPLDSVHGSAPTSPALAGRKRKRSSDSDKASSYSTKRVHFMSEIKARPIIQKPGLRSLPYEADVEI